MEMGRSRLMNSRGADNMNCLYYKSVLAEYVALQPTETEYAIVIMHQKLETWLSGSWIEGLCRQFCTALESLVDVGLAPQLLACAPRCCCRILHWPLVKLTSQAPNY